MIKAIFVDFDKTLITDDNRVSELDKIAINKIRDMGIKFVPCTGRTLTEIRNNMKDVFVPNDNDYILGINSSFTAKYDGTIINQEPLKKDLVKKVFDYVKDLEVALILFMIDGICIYQSEYSGFDKKPNVKYNSEDIYQTIEDNNIYKFALMIKEADTRDNPLAKIRDDILELTDNQVEAAFAFNNFCEMTAVGRNKAKGVKELCQILNIDLKDTMCIGDSENDIEVMKIVGYKACPSNAFQEIKDMCDYIASVDNNNSAVSEVINHFIID